MNTGDIIIKVRAEVEGAISSLSVLKKRIGEASRPDAKPFQGWALSVMFFGMQLQRTFNQIYNSSSHAFQEVMHSVYGTVTAYDNLNASLMYLGFVVGEALSPMVSWLSDIVQRVAEWASEHPTLTAAILGTMAVLGGFLFLMGFLTLAMSGVGTMMTIFSGIMGVLVPASAYEAAAAIGWFGIALQALKFVGIVAGILSVLFWIYRMQEAMGGWLEFGKSVIRGVLRVFALLGSVSAGIFSELANDTGLAWNAIMDILQNSINWIIKKGNELISWVNQFLPSKLQIPLITVKADFSGAKTQAKQLGEAFLDTYSSVLGSYMDWESTGALAPSKGYSNSANLVPTYNNTSGTSSSSKTPVSSPQSTSVTNNITIQGTNMNVNEIMEEVNRQIQQNRSMLGVK